MTVKKVLFIGLFVGGLVSVCVDALTPSEVGREIASGIIDAADHEAQDGFFNIDYLSMKLNEEKNPDAVQFLRQHRGKWVKVLLVLEEQQALQRIER